MTHYKTAKAAASALAGNAPDGPRRDLINKLIDSRDWDRTIQMLHELMDTPAPAQPVNLSVTDRARRLHYIWSEFLELVDASGFKLVTNIGVHALTAIDKTSVYFEHQEGSIQDRVEMLDGLADIIVVSLGMAVEMGQKMHDVFHEAVMGSVTKVDPETLRVKKNDGIEVPDEPVGKWIKGPYYMPPQIHRLIRMPKENES